MVLGIRGVGCAQPGGIEAFGKHLVDQDLLDRTDLLQAEELGVARVVLDGANGYVARARHTNTHGAQSE